MDHAMSGPLRAGAAQVEITPVAGTQLAGDVGRRRPAHLIGDPLYARALVLEAGGRKLCLLALDITVLTKRCTDRIRRQIVDELGFAWDAVMVHATQTHSAPSLGHFILSDEFQVPPEFDWVRGGDAAYDAWAEPRIVEAARLAQRALQPVELGVGSGIEGRMAFNRRAVMRDGSVTMPGRRWNNPLGPTGICYLEGPMDPEVGVLALRNAALHLPALLVNYTCHPVHVFPRLVVSADWPGALVDELRQRHGADCTPIVTNGACGNINPWPPFDPDYVEDHRQMGRVLADTVNKVLETLTFQPEVVLDWRAKTLKIPLRELDPVRLEKAQRLLAERPQPVWADASRTYVDLEWVLAAGLVDLYNLRQRSPEYDYDIQVFRIGDAALVGLPGEPFVEGGLAIKLASPTYPTYIVHDITQYVGYLPTQEAFGRGGHEMITGNWSRLVPEALEQVVATSVELLNDLFKPQA